MEFDKKNKNRIFKNFFSLAVLRGFQMLIPLITLPYLVRTIGLEKYGLLNFALSLGLYLGAIIQYGFGITATGEMARNRNNAEKISEIYSVTITASLFLVLLSGLLILIVVSSFDRFSREFCLYIFSFLFVAFQNVFPIWFFQGLENMKHIAFLSLCSNIVFLIGMFSFVRAEEDYLMVPFLQFMGSFTSFLLALIVINKIFNVRYRKPKIGEIKISYVKGFHVFVSQLAPNLYNNTSVFVLGVFFNSALVGAYSAAHKVIEAIVSLGYILSKAFFPYLSRSLEKFGFFERLMLAVGFLFSFIAFFCSGWISEILFSGENSNIGLYIRYLSISIFFLFVSMTYSTNYLVIVGKDKLVKNISLVVSLFFLGVAIIIIPFWGVWGVVATILGARSSLALFYYLSYMKIAKNCS